MPINNKVKAFFILKDLTQEKIAEVTDTTQQNVSLKTNKAQWKLKDLLKIADEVNCNIAFIDRDTKEPIMIFDENDL